MLELLFLLSTVTLAAKSLRFLCAQVTAPVGTLPKASVAKRNCCLTLPVVVVVYYGTSMLNSCIVGADILYRDLSFRRKPRTSTGGIDDITYIAENWKMGSARLLLSC